jgi:hypothetical protein
VGTGDTYPRLARKDGHRSSLKMDMREQWLTDSNQQVEPQEKKKTPKGRAKKRITYTRRFVNVTLTGGKRKVSIQSH